MGLMLFLQLNTYKKNIMISGSYAIKFFDCYMISDQD